jgi:two-component system, OmpR family, phosphate regulon response regulator PhoB
MVTERQIMDGSILVIDDDAAARELLAVNLRHAGYTVSCARNLGEARARTTETRPDLVLLDHMASGGHALSYTRQLRCDQRTSGIAIIVIGADRLHEQDTVAALESGADDCVCRSVSVNEVLARVRAVMRRSAPQRDDDVLEIAGLRFDPAARRVSVGNQEIKLCAIEYRLLRYFMSHPERILSRGKLLDEVWGDHVCVEERAVDIHVRRLRRALDPTGHSALIETIRGMGYRLRREESPNDEPEAVDDDRRSHHQVTVPHAAYLVTGDRRRAQRRRTQ